MSTAPPSETDETEAQLVERAQSGDAAAFAQIVRLHQAAVRVYIAFRVHRPDWVEDLAQDVFLAAHRRLGSFRGEAPLGRWLLGVARKRVLEFLRNELRRESRKERSLPAMLHAWRAAMAEEEADGPAEREAELAALKACLERLPAPGSELVAQHYFQDRSLASIAEAQGRNESAVRMALLRARQALRDCVRHRLVGAAG